MPRNGIKKQFWLSEKHVKKLAEHSKKTLLPETTIIRFLLDGYHPKALPGDEFYDYMEELLQKAQQLTLSTHILCQILMKQYIFTLGMMVETK